MTPGQATVLPVEGADVERIVVDRPQVSERVSLWRSELDRLGVVARQEDVDNVAALFALGAVQISSAARTVSRSATPGSPVDRISLARAARQHSRSGLEGIAEEVAAVYGWEDLVLTPATLRRVRELAEAVRDRHRVFDAWSFGRLGGGHASVRALFSGPSGHRQDDVCLGARRRPRARRCSASTCPAW